MPPLSAALHKGVERDHRHADGVLAIKMASVLVVMHSIRVRDDIRHQTLGRLLVESLNFSTHTAWNFGTAVCTVLQPTKVKAMEK
jgi:hypothetical protein